MTNECDGIIKLSVVNEVLSHEVKATGQLTKLALARRVATGANVSVMTAQDRQREKQTFSFWALIRRSTEKKNTRDNHTNSDRVFQHSPSQ